MRQAKSGERFSGVLRRFAALVSIAVAGMVMAPGAFAHDQMVGSDPATGATVKASPTALVLMYSAELKNIGTTVVLTDSDGNKYDAAATVSGQNLTVGVRDTLSDGEYTLEWRVVSSDGHPIEGTSANGQALTFTVKGSSATASASTGSTSSSSASSASAAETSEAATSASTSAAAPTVATDSMSTPNPVQEAAQNSGLSPWLIGIIVGIAAIGAAVVVIAKNRKRN
ncbi:hypothetical protein HD598_001942 [Neomicrococcus aestuarii]|uniref:CopC domain-containing protein n=1 Tax=Neomicrococcus aestuarii TaxID=556325 RepID=A0A7W8TUP8_9MICC|nr:copper resistance CopC family protein [Neomicrococcus aestuarii]MBB5513255.1 hypothetical protein [Neomicrococcus aestuarii]